MSEQTYWNGEPCEARIVRVIVGNSRRFRRPWFLELVGQEREAVEVTYGGAVFYLDNWCEKGWLKVTKGRGRPQVGHDSLDIERIVDP